MKAVLCSMCRGKGTVEKSLPITPRTFIPIERICDNCGGKGWMEVGDETVDFLTKLEVT